MIHKHLSRTSEKSCKIMKARNKERRIIQDEQCDNGEKLSTCHAGDCMFLRDMSPDEHGLSLLRKKWRRQYRAAARLYDLNYRVRIRKENVIVTDVNRMKPYFGKVEKSSRSIVQK
jgi:hypothetical protein